jgi:hypothetical protein
MLHLIAQGAAGDFHLHNKFHVTITPSGEVTAVKSNSVMSFVLVEALPRQQETPSKVAVHPRDSTG